MKEEQCLPEALGGKAFGLWILIHPPGTTGGLAESIRCALGHSEQFRGCGTQHAWAWTGRWLRKTAEVLRIGVGRGGGIPPGSDSQTFTDLETDLPY